MRRGVDVQLFGASAKCNRGQPVHILIVTAVKQVRRPTHIVLGLTFNHIFVVVHVKSQRMQSGEWR